MNHTAVIYVMGLFLLVTPVVANENQPVDVPDKKVDEKTETAVRRYAARIAVAKIAIKHGDAKQARIELSLTNPELRGWEYDYLLSEAMQFGKERHQSRQVCDAVEFGTRGGTLSWDYRLNNAGIFLPTAGDECLAISADGTSIVTGGDDLH